jgi:hypothetical protein
MGILMFRSQQFLGFPNGYFPTAFAVKSLYERESSIFLTSSIVLNFNLVNKIGLIDWTKSLTSLFRDNRQSVSAI